MLTDNQFLWWSIEILAFVVLLAPATWEQYNDKSGDFNKRPDVFYRAGIMLLCSIINYFMREFAFLTYHTPKQILIGVGRAFLMSFGWFLLVFDYWVNYRLGHKVMWNKENTGWIQYLGKKVVNVKGKVENKIDNISLWRNTLGWKGRLVVRLVVFGVCLLIYLS